MIATHFCLVHSTSSVGCLMQLAATLILSMIFACSIVSGRARARARAGSALRSTRLRLRISMVRASSNDLTSQLFERKLWSEGYKYVIGVDEAGRGPLAGPVVAASLVCLDVDVLNDSDIDARDSKALSEKKREKIYEEIISKPEKYQYHVTCIDHARIDETNILKATMEAMALSIENLQKKLHCSDTSNEEEKKLSYALVDGNKTPSTLSIPARAIVKGDAQVHSIALASIIAKVTRDRMMVEYDKVYPGYGFAKHKGYGTREHIMSIHKLGPCAIHRMSFKPLKGG